MFINCSMHTYIDRLIKKLIDVDTRAYCTEEVMILKACAYRGASDLFKDCVVQLSDKDIDDGDDDE